ncbi:hypothetical protein [Nocardia sp. NPDC051570]|uniref:hypothetical protein n=1 Tax=Nocardia sp. NPDC051570 TaxID=3364324 RepID=UPI0037A836E3
MMDTALPTSGSEGDGDAVIAPYYAVNGWQYSSDGGQPRLHQQYPKATGTIRLTTGRSCSWTIRDLDGQLVREASAASAAEAVTAADGFADRSLDA